MTPEAEATTLLPTNQRIFPEHHRGNVLETYRRLIHRHLKYFSQPINHAGAGYRLNYGTTFTACLQQVKAEQGKNLKLGQKRSLLINNTHAVGITIGSQPHIRSLLPDYS